MNITNINYLVCGRWEEKFVLATDVAKPNSKELYASLMT